MSELPVSSSDLDRKRAAFARLHESGCFVLPNPWDVGSARALERLGFVALATTSAGFAWSSGRPDNDVTLEQVLAHLESMAAAVSLPLNADFEDGFAVAPQAVGRNVARAVATGIAGLSIEDSTRSGERKWGRSHAADEPAGPLYEFAHAVDRVAAARAAIDQSGAAVVLTARHEGYLVGRPDLDETIRRLQAFAAAGADCLYAPGIRERADLEVIVRAVAPKPVNVLVAAPGWKRADLAALGVRRISVGGALARTAWAGFLSAAKEILEHDTFDALGQGRGAGNLNALLAD